MSERLDPICALRRALPPHVQLAEMEEIEVADAIAAAVRADLRARVEALARSLTCDEWDDARGAILDMIDGG